MGVNVHAATAIRAHALARIGAGGFRAHHTDRHDLVAGAFICSHCADDLYSFVVHHQGDIHRLATGSMRVAECPEDDFLRLDQHERFQVIILI